MNTRIKAQCLLLLMLDRAHCRLNDILFTLFTYGYIINILNKFFQLEGYAKSLSQRQCRAHLCNTHITALEVAGSFRWRTMRETVVAGNVLYRRSGLKDKKIKLFKLSSFTGSLFY